MATVLAIDYGKKRIGLASGSDNLKIASPKGIIENKNDPFVLAKLKEICDKFEISKIVIGIPLDMKDAGERTMIAKLVKKFALVLEENLKLEVVLFDERLSTFEADSISVGKRGAKDDLSAQIILQRYFDSI
ncbi:MAG: Holliday junction resolvase RuvX [Candidatus Gracilibacteria bacterium]|jgi:putative Holliday junction resolvase